jgi:hypothetical protein
MSPWFRRFIGLILLVTVVGIATCQSFVKAETQPLNAEISSEIVRFQR